MRVDWTAVHIGCHFGLRNVREYLSLFPILCKVISYFNLR